jgi:cyclase
MLKHRIIPVLLNSKVGIVKTRNFVRPIYIGDPINTAKIFNDKQVDELLVYDIDRSKLNLGPNFELIEQIVAQCFMPVSYGGGIRSLMDAKEVFNLGVEKVVLQKVLFSDFNVINEIATTYGSQSVIVSLDVIRGNNNKFYVYDYVHGRKLDLTLESILIELNKSLMGELVITSVDREGTLTGFDLELIQKVKSFIDAPLIAHGGAGNIQDLAQAINSGADAVAAGSLFVFYGSPESILLNYPKYEHIEKLLDVI